MDFDIVIRKRASIKNYSDKKISYDKILEAIEAATLAPSPGNLSLLRFIIIEDEKTIEKIAMACQQPFITKASMLIVICSLPKQAALMYDARADRYLKHCAGASIENFLLKITDLGLASCWVGAFSELTIRAALKIPEGTEIEAVLPVGYPAKTDKTQQKPKPELVNLLFFEEYGNIHQKEIRKVGMH
jgi:nitroreductase